MLEHSLYCFLAARLVGVQRAHRALMLRQLQRQRGLRFATDLLMRGAVDRRLHMRHALGILRFEVVQVLAKLYKARQRLVVLSGVRRIKRALPQCRLLLDLFGHRVSNRERLTTRLFGSLQTHDILVVRRILLVLGTSVQLSDLTHALRLEGVLCDLAQKGAFLLTGGDRVVRL